MTTQDVSSVDRQQTPADATNVSDAVQPSGRLPGALMTGAVLLVLWAGFHWYDPASWAVGIPMALIGGALTLCLPAAGPLRLSPIGALRFVNFAVVGILRGAVDVSWRSLFPQKLQPGCLSYRTYLPEGRPRRLFAIAITLLPGTLTARIKGNMLTVHALDLSDATRPELAALEASIAELYKLDPKEMLP